MRLRIFTAAAALAFAGCMAATPAPAHGQQQAGPPSSDASGQGQEPAAPQAAAPQAGASAPGESQAQADARAAARGAPAAPPTASCALWEATYATTATLRITDTPMGAGDGTYSVGPGTLVLRVDARAGRAQLVSFDLHEHFSVKPKAVMWNATIVTDATMRATPDVSGFAASGAFSDGTLRWTSPVHGYHSEGSLVCDGSLCGKFGAPPAGRSPVVSPPTTVRLQPFHFDASRETFQMPFALVSESDSPKQKTYVALSGRRTRVACLTPAGVVASAP